LQENRNLLTLISIKTQNRMGFPVTGHVVFIYHSDVGSHHPQFASFSEAEKFANDLRALTKLTVSEPIPVIATESHKERIADFHN